jgi:hypothetical protein
VGKKRTSKLEEWLSPQLGLLSLPDLGGKKEPTPKKLPPKSAIAPSCIHPRLCPGLDADWCPDCRRSIPHW